MLHRSNFVRRHLVNEENFCLNTNFAILDESIEPPKRVQAIAGPQSNTLLVSWEQSSLPPTTTTRGYRVLVDGRQLQDVTNPLSKLNKRK